MTENEVGDIKLNMEILFHFKYIHLFGYPFKYIHIKYIHF